LTAVAERARRAVVGTFARSKKTPGRRAILLERVPRARGEPQPRLDGGRDALDREAFERDSNQLCDQGLYVAMRPWESYFLAPAD
jgi:hypothetical protein